MKKIGKPYFDQGKMWQDVEFEPGDKVPEDNQFFYPGSGWTDGLVYEKWTQTAPSCFRRRIPVENKVQQNAKKNLHLLKEMLLHKVKIVRKIGSCVHTINSPAQLLDEGEFFEVRGETHNYLKEDQIGPDKYTILEALAEGKQVQFRKTNWDTTWNDFNPFDINCHFDAMNHLYRIKPEEIPDTVIKWTSVATPPDKGRVVYILYQSGSIHTVEYWDGLFVNSMNVKGWSYA